MGFCHHTCCLGPTVLLVVVLATGGCEPSARQSSSGAYGTAGPNPNERVEYRAGVRVPPPLPPPPGPPVVMPRGLAHGIPHIMLHPKQNGVLAFIDHDGRWRVYVVRSRLGSAYERNLHIQGVSGPLVGIGPVDAIGNVWDYAIVHRPDGITWQTNVGPGEARYRLQFRAPGNGCIRLHVLDHQYQPTVRIYVGPNEVLAPSAHVMLCP